MRHRETRRDSNSPPSPARDATARRPRNSRCKHAIGWRPKGRKQSTRHPETSGAIRPIWLGRTLIDEPRCRRGVKPKSVGSRCGRRQRRNVLRPEKKSGCDPFPSKGRHLAATPIARAFRQVENRGRHEGRCWNPSSNRRMPSDRHAGKWRGNNHCARRMSVAAALRRKRERARVSLVTHRVARRRRLPGYRLSMWPRWCTGHRM